MENSIMYYNEIAFNESVRQAKEFIKNVQPLLTRHYELGNLFKVDSVYDIQSKMMRGAGSYRNAIIDNLRIPEVASGIKMKREAYVETMEFPSLGFFDTFAENNRGMAAFGAEALCKIDGKKIVLNQVAVDNLKERHTYRADSPLKQEILKTHLEAAAALNKLNGLLVKAGKGSIGHDDQYGTLFIAHSNTVQMRADYYAGRGYIQANL